MTDDPAAVDTGTTEIGAHASYRHRLGTTTWLWDQRAPELESTLCVAEREKLDHEYPPVEGNVRLMLIAPGLGLPAMRLAFYVTDDDTTVVYVAISVRGISDG